MTKTSFTFLLCILYACLAYAQDNTKPEQHRNNKTSILAKKQETSTSGKPRMPGRAVLNCEYGEGYISIQLPDWAESAEVTVSENEMPVWFCTMTPQDNTAGLPALNGEYTITCELDDQSTYVGTLVF